MSAELVELAGGLVGFLITLMVLSYIIGDNFLFRLALYIFIGASAGYAVVIAWTNVIWPQLLLPLVNGNQNQRLFVLFPLFLSGLLLLKISPRLGRYGVLALAFLVGVGVATAIGGALLGTLIPQGSAAINQFDLSATSGGNRIIQLVSAGFLLFGTITTLLYFQFGRRAVEDPLQASSVFWRGIELSGQIFLAVTLGVLFAGVYSMAMTALIDRLGAARDFLAPLFFSG